MSCVEPDQSLSVEQIACFIIIRCLVQASRLAGAGRSYVRSGSFHLSGEQAQGMGALNHAPPNPSQRNMGDACKMTVFFKDAWKPAAEEAIRSTWRGSLVNFNKCRKGWIFMFGPGKNLSTCVLRCLLSLYKLKLSECAKWESRTGRGRVKFELSGTTRWDFPAPALLVLREVLCIVAFPSVLASSISPAPSIIRQEGHLPDKKSSLAESPECFPSWFPGFSAWHPMFSVKNYLRYFAILL